MPSHVTLDMVYDEIRSLHRDLETGKYALIPVEPITLAERKRLNALRTEMESGNERPLDDVMREL